VTLAEHLGDESILHLRLATGPSLTVKAPGEVAARLGDTVHIGFDQTHVALFRADGQAMRSA